MVVIPVPIFRLGDKVILSQRMVHKFPAVEGKRDGLEPFLALQHRVLEVVKVRRIADTCCLNCGPFVDYIGHKASCGLFDIRPPHPQKLQVACDGTILTGINWLEQGPREFSGYWFELWFPSRRTEFRRWACFTGRWLVGFLGQWGPD